MNKSEIESLSLLKKNHDEYPKSPEEAQLEVFDNRYPTRDYTIEFEALEFTSLCPVTNQPDFGKIYIRYIPDKLCIESKSLKLYLFSYRNYNTFHENVVNQVLDDCVKICYPRWMQVCGDFMPRGGIALKINAEHKK